jgi:glycosyltransferase involved in cell wall biosynthesis
MRNSETGCYCRRFDEPLHPVNALVRCDASPGEPIAADLAGSLAGVSNLGTPDAAFQGNRVQLSVVIPCRNSATYLREQLVALADEHLDCRWEIIFVDNGSTDRCLELVEQERFRFSCAVRIVDASDMVGAAHARNVGATHAKGKFLVFLDADDVISAGYLTALRRGLAHHALVAGILDHRALNPEWAAASRPMWQTSGLGQDLYPWAGSGTIGVRTEIFRSVDGFDEELPNGEDVDFCWRLNRDCGVVPYLCADAVLRYRHRESFSALFRQGVRYGISGPALYRRWRSSGMSRRGPSSVARNWVGVIRRLLTARSKADWGGAVYLLGNRIGLIWGSLRYRVIYL